MNLTEFKQQNPAYADVPDQQLATALHKKFYSSIPFDEFASKIGLGQPDPDVPVIGSDDHAIVVQPPEREPIGIGQQILGAGETALTLGTGATGGLAGTVIGAGRGIAREMWNGEFGSQAAANRIAQSAVEGSKALTYAPRTEAGQRQVRAVGEAAELVPPFVPFAAELQSVAAPVAMQAAQAARPVIRQAATRAADIVKSAPKEESGFGAKSVGAASITGGIQRREAAQSLPVPIELTEGQATRDFGAIRFERETAKNPDLGLPIRERFNLQNQQLQQNLDYFIEGSQAEIRDIREFGAALSGTLQAEADRGKARTRWLYRVANESEEGNSPVSLEPLVNYLNDQRANASDQNASILNTIGRHLIAQGAAVLDESGNYVFRGSIPLRNIEEIRKTSNRIGQSNPTNGHFSTEINGVIDAATENAGGQLFRAARAARRDFGRKFEQKAIVSRMLSNKKNSLDRQVALEDVVDHVVGGSRDDIFHLKKVLQNAGEDGSPLREQGHQAWREVQGQVLQRIQREATKNVTRNELGDPIVSAHALNKIVNDLDETGKLDLFFGKHGAAQLRDLNDIAKDVITVPPGSVNNSNTATVLLGALDAIGSGLTGMPPFVVTGLKILKDERTKAKTRKQVQQHLDYGKTARH